MTATRAAELPSASAGLARPELPKNLILYGPPGTGKTWEALEKIRPDFGERVEMITFHPNFAYQEFVEGLRPVSDGATARVRYEVVPGVFKRVCERALEQPELPFLLVIDEINRAHVAAVFGELITLSRTTSATKVKSRCPTAESPSTS